VCFQPCVGPGQAISATTLPNQNLSKLRGKNPATHRREYFQVTLPIGLGLAALTPRAATKIRAFHTMRLESLAPALQQPTFRENFESSRALNMHLTLLRNR
jgi:hypothetical protein